MRSEIERVQPPFYVVGRATLNARRSHAIEFQGFGGIKTWGTRGNTKVKLSALAPGAPLVMGVAARGIVQGKVPQALHSGATEMLDGSIAPHRTQLVIDMFLADIPAMRNYLRTKREADLHEAKPIGFEEEAETLGLIGESPHVGA